MGNLQVFIISYLSISCVSIFMPNLVTAQLNTNYYAQTCPNVESIVRNVVNQKLQQTFVTIPAVLRLFFHDCFVEVPTFSPCMNLYLFKWS